MRPTQKQIAEARALITRFLAAYPDHSLGSALRTMMTATVPPTKSAAVAVLVKHANEAGDWASDVDDEQRAMDVLEARNPDELDGGWDGSIWAQWQTIVHFMGGAE